MARSNYIYVVSYSPYDGVAIAFTVKHEMISWLWKRDNHSLYDGRLSYFIQRFRDRIEEDPVNITDEIEAILKARVM